MKKEKLNKKERRARDHAAAIKPKRGGKVQKGAPLAQSNTDSTALPARTSHYDKKTGIYKTAGEKISSLETPTDVTYQWVEDRGGENVQIKRRSYKKDHAKARYEEDWVSECGNHCKINKDKFDSNYNEIFGDRKMGAAAGKFKKFKKKY